MPTYTYIAKSLDGQTQTGKLEAKDERQLAQDLKNQGMVLIRADAWGKAKGLELNINIFKRVSLPERIIMVRNIGVMFSTGLPLVKCFGILAEQAKKQNIKDALFDIRDKVSRGENLSDALSGYPNIFSELFVSMIKVGEESGTLDEIFQVLATQLTREHELKSKLRNAMIYPSIILMVMAVVGIIIITFVLPSLNIFFTSLNVDIPVYTRFLLDLGNFLSKQWYLLIVIPFLAAAAFWLAIRTKNGKKALDAFLLKMPAISPIVKKSNAALLIRSISSLISAGVSLVRSLEVSSTTIGNTYYKEAMIEASKRIKKGEKFSNSLKAYENIFPVGVIDMIEVGEETGKTSDILKKLSDFYEQEAINGVEKLTTMIEPVLIIVLGLAVGLFAFSIIEPIYSSLQTIE